MHHSACLLEDSYNLRHLGRFLADREIDTEHVAALLVDDSVEGDGGLTRLAVTDYQLALPAPNRDHRVDGFDARLHRCIDVLPVDYAGGNTLNRAGLDIGRKVTLAVDRLAEGIYHAT